MKNLKLSNKEMDVMLVFWNTDEALASSDIPKIESALNINTVRVAIKNLLQKSAIEVADIAQRGTVLTRTYRPTISFEDYLSGQLQHMNFNSLNLMSALVRQETDHENLDELEKIIRERRRSIK
ncbi:hypothetical protein EBB54_29550 [Schaedlerella arabinosiphila]|uniref:Penicillinase repressor n=1 Tax=Schaedlerella arabinosiphila TaxID=2044587 RepID=A0A426DQJ5_9FIRM|nr:BlaI/MecI/CopY family transcriptional regulator [Schaedlerella arabinosiphila]MCI9632932.1 BlaI/MecI/CopY family transcriptional regulator [Ruminococcus sp.]RRK35018.1 hypothetical protein EBB54_29550 [Schaedlerella arabinosiphila]